VFLFVSLLATGVARVAGGGLLYDRAGLGITRGDDTDAIFLSFVHGLLFHKTTKAFYRHCPRCLQGPPPTAPIPL
jgi:hypothetical protein